MLEQEEDSVKLASSPWSSLPPGSLLDRGRYRIVRLLGQGGMGAVYEAENTLTQKRVAIKRMHPMQVTPAGTERLVREARAAARVRHRNAVDVYDVVQDDGTVFLVMELLQGEPLSAWLARGDQPVHRAIALLLPAMRAVAAAHRQGVIHRDIKPDNIFLAEEEGAPDIIPKVVDFGISKVDSPDLPQATLTRTGGAIGTPRYMSYEQLAGEANIDGRADVYAFGVILYQILTGRLPFEAPSFPALVAKVITTVPVDPKELSPEVPSVLARIVLWALARKREERIASMEELIRELEPFSTQHGFRAEMTLQGDEALATPVETPQYSGLRRRSWTRASSNEPMEHDERASAPEAPARPESRWGRAPLAIGLAVVLALGGGALKLLTSDGRAVQEDSQVPKLPKSDVTAQGSGADVLPVSPSPGSLPTSGLHVDAGAPSDGGALKQSDLQRPKPRPTPKPKRPVGGTSSPPSAAQASEAKAPPASPTGEPPASEPTPPASTNGEGDHKPSGFRVRLPLSEQF